MGGKLWTPSEENKLMLMFAEGKSYDECAAAFPGRTRDAIKIFAARKQIENARPREWTKREIAIIRDIYASPLAIKENIHRLPGRTYGGVLAMAQRLGIEAKANPEKGTTSGILKLAIKLLSEHGKMTTRDISALAQVSEKGLRRALNKVHGKTTRIAGWKRITPFHWVPEWALGTEPDAPKPAPMTKSESYQRLKAIKATKQGAHNPFATAAGLVQAPTGQTGRVFKQDMEIDQWFQSRAA